MASAGGNSRESISLNLNPLLDVFSILITFLLMSFSTDPISHDVPKDLTLPESKTIAALDEIPTVIVTRNEVLVGDKKIANVIGGDVEERDRAQGAIFPLYEELKILAEQNKKLAKTEVDKNKTGTLTVEIDKDHRFKLLKRVMISGQQAEFITYKLTVSKELN